MSAVFEAYRSVFDKDGATRVDYPWDDWKSTFYFYFIDAPLGERLSTVSDPAVAAFALAISEWICARLWPYPDVKEPLDFIDAAWAVVLGAGGCDRVEFDREDWQGPVRGPLRFAQLIAADTIFAAREDRVYLARACWAHNLATHVLDAPQLHVFQEWVAASCERLNTFHPDEVLEAASIFDDHFPTPKPAPPAAFCHRTRYDPSRIDKYISDHMSVLSRSNRYLL